MSIEMNKQKQIRAKKLEFARTDSSKEMPINEADKSSNKLNMGAMLEAIYSQIYREDISPEGGSGRSTALAEYGRLNEINKEQFQVSAKAFVDQILMDRKLIDKECECSESRPFSDALEILKSNADLWEKIKRQRGNSSKGSLTSRMKPNSKNTKYSENVACHCSLLQSHHRSSSSKSTSFSFGEMKRKLKYSFGRTRKEPYQTLMDATTVEHSHLKTSGDESPCRRMDAVNSANSFSSAKLKDKNPGFKSSCFSESSCMNKPVRDKSNPSNIQGTGEFDVILEAKMHLSARLETLNATETPTSTRCPKILGQILSSPEHDIWLTSLNRKKENGSVSSQMRFSPSGNSPASCQTRKGKQMKYVNPLRQNEEATSYDFRKHDSTLEILDSNTNFSMIESADTETEVHENIGFATIDLKSNGRAKMVELESIPNPEITSSSEGPSELSGTMEKTNRIELLEDDGNTVHLRLDSPSVLDDSPWTPLSAYQLDGSTKDREEHPSPVSVLEPFFMEDVNSPPSIIRRRSQPLQPRRLDYEGSSSEASAVDPTIIPTLCLDEKASISGYVNAVLQASRLNWDELSAIMPLTEHLLYESLFEEVELPSNDSPYDPKLLFDHINEVLLEVHRRQFGLPPWLSFIKSKIQFAPLEQHIVDEVTKEADFYLLPRTEKRTLDQLVRKDVAKSGLWLDIRLDTEEIVSHISEYVLEESILYLILDFDTLS